MRPQGEFSKRESAVRFGDMLNAPPQKLSIRSFFMQEGAHEGSEAWGEWLKQKTRVKSKIKSLNK